MDLKLEVVIIPVSDVDRAKKFYEEALGFRVDVDYRAAVYEEALGFRHRGAASYRIVQLTPPGSQCSIQIGTGITQVTPGAYQGMYLITSGLDPRRADCNSFVSFSDPDGNGWFIQEVKQRAPGR
jgi:catechol 2,3-dioxygenase-like lactoylglutathione lyase family enzyme